MPSTGQGSELHTKLCFSRLNAKEQIQSTKVGQHRVTLAQKKFLTMAYYRRNNHKYLSSLFDVSTTKTALNLIDYYKEDSNNISPYQLVNMPN